MLSLNMLCLFLHENKNFVGVCTCLSDIEITITSTREPATNSSNDKKAEKVY